MGSRVFEIISRRILKMLSSGEIPWRTEKFTLDKCNFKRRIPYSALNQILLSDSPDRFYLSPKEIKELKAVWRPGSRKPIITFWKIYEKDTGALDTSGKPHVEKIPVLRFYEVIGCSDVVGLKETEPASLPAPQLPVDSFVLGTGATIEVMPIRIVSEYIYDTDTIYTPPKEAFAKPDHYYYSLFRSLIRWTGPRMWVANHQGRNPEDHEEFGMESLIEEIGSAMLMKAYGLEWENLGAASAARIASGWAKAIGERSDLVVYAAGRAEKAVDVLMKKHKAEGDILSQENIMDKVRGL